jgi:signal transduction histidine kinase
VETGAVEMTLGKETKMVLHILRDVSGRVDLRRRLMEAQEDERRRISRDIHDSVTQLLVGAGLQIDRFGRHFANQEDLANELSQVRYLIGQATREVRQICLRLRPDTLDDFGLIPSIRSYISAMAVSRPKVYLEVGSGFGRLLPDVETVLYRITQEALANSIQHSQAENITVSLERTGRQVSLQVKDDGRGFDPKRAFSDRAQRGLGLEGMAERVELLGGYFAVVSAPAKGTTVRVEIELDPVSP